MKTLRRMIHREALVSVAYATLLFLALFFFFDLVDELRSVNRYSAQGYDFARALLVTALTVPGHLYELLPITVLIGTIFVMARFAQSSEFTIMRTSGMGPGQALRTLLLLGGFFVVLTFVVGDYVAPQCDRLAETLKMRFTGRISSKAMGAWLKERQQDNSFAVNVRALAPGGKMLDVRIFEFDAKGQLAAHTHAASAHFGEDGASWVLEQAQRSRFHLEDEAHAWVERTQAATLAWPTHIKAEMVSATLRKRERMTTLDLFEYIRHLKANGQTAQRYEIELGRKVFYPLSCLVMVVLALPFAYLHFRSGGISAQVFGGIMAGLSFFLLNNLFSHVGNLQSLSPWIAAAAPSLIYSLLSLAAFGWLVLRR
ncbi:LPS export ABC transporter permease LptG [Extensimonas sp. H3M7-6]|uniref:LPS export ABC transporter permease LptG n=1 Tax=Extensimonas soli TaxID=3031322 RepID=UPI0023DBFB80|nr:LPS export ABC transporter permease LptG [Extensimonas sp. H3M7-6]MDF1483126.1 LPS export ABC transporter permease LptG [Extensimonas sp. H3M7-6]